jgi:hypothetical protein
VPTANAKIKIRIKSQKKNFRLSLSFGIFPLECNFSFPKSVMAMAYGLAMDFLGAVLILFGTAESINGQVICGQATALLHRTACHEILNEEIL